MLPDPIRFVLIETSHPGNIGAVARAMHNFGLTDLFLVAPEADGLSDEARQRSTRGEYILHQARTVASLDEALADCVLVAGTSANVGGPFRRQSVRLPEEVMPGVIEALASGPAALVFG